MFLQIFVAVTSLTGLILAAVINEREHIGEAFETEKKLLSESEATKERLEELVRERTLELASVTPFPSNGKGLRLAGRHVPG
jgi:hypothetical protein